MEPLPYPPAWPGIVFWTLLGLFTLGECAIQLRSRFHSGGTRAEWWSLLVVVVAVAGGMVGGFTVATWRAAEIGGGRWPLLVVGLVLMAAGLFVRQWAILTLGRFFTVDVRLHANQPVVDRGPYRWVRHPSYTGLLVFLVGLALALGSWASLALLTVLPTAGLVVRIRAEERALFAGLGEPYAQFAATRRRLFPGLW